MSKKAITCDKCKGVGRSSSGEKCPKCGGEGTIVERTNESGLTRQTKVLNEIR